MAISTLYDPEDYINTSTDILVEFIRTYLGNEVEVTTEKPMLDDTIQLTIPILWVDNMINTTQKNQLLGKRVDKNIQGEFCDMEFVCYWIISDELGGIRKCRELAGKLQSAIQNKAGDLISAGLKNPRSISFRSISKDGSMVFYGGRQMVFARVLVYF